MAKKNPTLYSVSKTFIWFAVTSFVLLVSLIAIVHTDYNREWKVWQKKFTQLKTDLAAKDLKAAESGIDKQKLSALEKEKKEAQAVFQTHKAESDRLKKEIEALDTKIVKQRGDYQNLKQFLDSNKYFFEETTLHKDPKAKEYKAKLDDLGPKTEKVRLEVEVLEKTKEDKELELRELTQKEKDIEKQIAKLSEERDRTKRRLDKVRPTLAKDILNAPMLDFVAPSIKVQQVVLEDLYNDYHFAKVQKVDRCITCHLGIDQKGFEEAPQPFTTHPKLDLYLGSGSPHATEKFGCTVCHGGNGESVNFKDSAHTPKNEEQGREWKKKYQWREIENWEPKMFPPQYVEASCAKCHTGVMEVPKADKLNKGRQLAETYGCFNCHKIDGFDNRWKVGPDLQHVQSKLSAEWMEKWLEDPTSFRPSTKMPKIFNLTNTSSPEDIEKNRAAIKGITAYLVKNSEPVTMSSVPVNGDKANGEKLVKEIGCLGCHSAAGVTISNFGPELSGLGSKVKPEWLYTWLKNPKHYSKDTRMPNLRLTDKEASDIVSYLLSLKNTEFESRKAGEPKSGAIDDLALTFLQGTLRKGEAETALKKMSGEEKLEFIGKKSIAHQGCYSCHTIKGFEDAKPIGADISNEGQKDLHQFDFGFVDIGHTRQDWIAQKLKDPRIFDQGKLKAYHEKLRMPQFNFTDDEIEALTLFVLSLSREQIPLEMHKRLDLKDEQTEKGRLIVAKFNCNGCHALDGKVGALREYVEDKGQAPPILDGEGAKVQEKWLHEFLKNPTTIRPWLTYHMPTFDFTEEELTQLVQYMANLDKQEIAYHGHEPPPTTQDKLSAGHKLYDTLQCIKCHQVSSESSAMGSSFLAPDLTLTKKRLKPEWVKQWLNDPQLLQEGTMMPTFFSEGQSPVTDVLGGDANAQIEAIRDYLYQYESSGTKKSEGSDPKNPIAK